MTWADYAEESPSRPGSIEFHREANYVGYLTKLWGLFNSDPLPVKPQHLSNLFAFVNGGRWLVVCETCQNSITPAEPGEDYCCCLCGQWYSVVWPADRETIESDLLTRRGHRVWAPERNWEPTP